MRPGAKRGRLSPARFGRTGALVVAGILTILPGLFASVQSASSLTKIVNGYYPSWARASFGHERIAFANLTHISHAFVWPDADGDLVIPDDFLYPELVAAAHANGVKVILSIGGWGNGDGFAPMAASPAARSRFIARVVEFCYAYDYDGADIDWEFVEGEDQSRDFSTLIKSLSAALHAMEPPRLLSIAAPAGDYYGRWIDFEELHPSFDLIGFMTYDFHGDWSDHSGYNAPLYACDGDTCGSVDEAFAYARSRQVPLDKLLLGVPFYGRSFDSPAPYGGFTTTAGYAFSEIMDLWLEGWGYQWDDCAKVPWLKGPNGQGMITFDDIYSVAWKCAYVLDKQAAGVIIWELSQDGFQGVPLLIHVFGALFRGIE